MDKQILQLLKKYLDNRCTPEELERVRTILHSGRYEEEWATVLREDAERSISEEVSHIFEEDRADRLLDRIVASAGMDDSGADEQSSGRVWYVAAASVLLLITAGLTFLTLSSVFEANITSETVTVAKEREQTEVLLPDGTRVWLNDLSKLSYPEEFGNNIRKVKLEGRAFFDVVSNPSKPFQIQTEELTVRVLGTSFDVSAYESDRDMTVAVASGSVSVEGPSFMPEVPGSAGEEKLSKGPFASTLQPGEQLTYDRKNRQYFRQTMALSDIRALREGRLVFQNQALINIVQALERRYQVTFRFDNESDKKQRLTFKPNSADLDEVLQVLSLVSGLEYELNDREVLMSKK